MSYHPRTCKHCGVEFTPSRRSMLYCSTTCKQYQYLDKKFGRTTPRLPQEKSYPETKNIPVLEVEPDEPPLPKQETVYHFKNDNEKSIYSYAVSRQDVVKERPALSLDEIIQIEKEYNDLSEDKKEIISRELDRWWQQHKPGVLLYILSGLRSNKEKP